MNTTELTEQITNLFKCVETVEVAVRDNKVYITVADMYDPPQFIAPHSFLTGMMEIAKLCGKTELTIDGTISKGGCETCDFGSSYGYEFIAWNKEDV